MLTHIISLRSLPPDMIVETILTKNVITSIEPDNIRQITDGDIPENLEFIHHTPDKTSPEQGLSLNQLTDGNFPAVTPTLIEFLGENSKQRAQLCWLHINRKFTRFDVSFQYVILDEEDQSRIFILPEDHKTDS